MAVGFEAGTHLANFYFKGLNVDGIGGILAAVAVMFVLTVIFEVLKVIKRNNEWLLRNTGTTVQRVCFRCAMTAAFCLETFLAYSLMLAAMTFNVWLFLAIIFGAGAGYYISRPLIKVTPPNAAGRLSENALLPDDNGEL